MAGQGNAAPIVIKRKKVIAGGGHHGGAWKVAYADFVTAMMAFFLLMWLLNATTEEQRKGIADFFKTTIPIVRISGGGDGALRGDSVFAEGDLAQSSDGGAERAAPPATGPVADGGEEAETAALEEVEQRLRAFTGDSMVLERLMRHVSSRITDEGLVIELFDLEGAPLFEADSNRPAPILRELVAMVGDVFAMVSNPVAVNAHVRAYPITMIENPAWALSADRAASVRDLLGGTALSPARVQRLSGFADRRPVAADAMAVRNNRIELILLRGKP